MSVRVSERMEVAGEWWVVCVTRGDSGVLVGVSVGLRRAGGFGDPTEEEGGMSSIRLSVTICVGSRYQRIALY